MSGRWGGVGACPWRARTGGLLRQMTTVPCTHPCGLPRCPLQTTCLSTRPSPTTPPHGNPAHAGAGGGCRAWCGLGRRPGRAGAGKGRATHLHCRLQRRLRGVSYIPDAELAVAAARRQQVGADLVELQALDLCVRSARCDVCMRVGERGAGKGAAHAVAVYPPATPFVGGSACCSTVHHLGRSLASFPCNGKPLCDAALTPPWCCCILATVAPCTSSVPGGAPTIFAGSHKQIVPSARPPASTPYCEHRARTDAASGLVGLISGVQGKRACSPPFDRSTTVITGAKFLHDLPVPPPSPRPCKEHLPDRRHPCPACPMPGG